MDPLLPDAAAISRAAELLRSGDLVAFPTETVYGLGAHALDARAVRRVFEAKGRPAFNPLIVHVPEVMAAWTVVSRWPDSAGALAERFWPGPLTLVLPRADRVPDDVTASMPTVGIRIPRHPVALALLREARIPVAAPSANRYTELSPTTAQHVSRALGGRIAMILDGGPTQVGIESTVVDLSGDRPMLLRPGAISAYELAEVVGPLGAPPPPVRADAPRPGPGMVEKHYAPRARLHLFDAGDGEAVRRVVELAHGHAQPAPEDRTTASHVRERVGALLLASPSPAALAQVIQEPRILPRDPAGYARRLYAALHELDDAGCTLVLVERVPGEGAWAGVRDRLERASHA